MYEIDTAVPIPPPMKAAFPFDKMKIGSSFAVPVIDGDRKKTQMRVLHAAETFRKADKKNKGFKITTRSGDDQIRVWRVS